MNNFAFKCWSIIFLQVLFLPFFLSFIHLLWFKMILMNFVWHMYFLFYVGYNFVCISFPCPPKKTYVLTNGSTHVYRCSSTDYKSVHNECWFLMQEPIGDAYGRRSQLDVVKIGLVKFYWCTCAYIVHQSHVVSIIIKIWY